MTRAVFLDTSAIYAFINKNDNHGILIETFLKTEPISLVTTNFVLAESLSLITKRLGKKIGLTTGEMLYKSSFVTLSYLDRKIQEEAWTLFQKYKDKDFDLIDAMSFVFCRKQRIDEALTLDHHFAQMGFKMHP